MHNHRNIEITDSLLAAYAKGTVTDTERVAVRQYLVNNPEKMNEVLKMMDTDDDLTLNSSGFAAKMSKGIVRPLSNIAAAALIPSLTHSAAAFAPHMSKSLFNNDKRLDERMDDLLDEIDSL